MDNLDWDATPITGSTSSSWKNQQQQIKESLVMSNSYRFAAPLSSRVDGFNQIQQQIVANANSSQCHDIGDSSASLAMDLQEFGGAFDPIHILSSWKISQRQEAATRLAADSVAAKSKIGSSSSFPPQNNYMPQFGVCGLMADLGSNGLLSKSRSPDCLLTATNTSNTDTNDGISVIFSNDPKTMWNIKTDNNNAVSSGESAVDAFNTSPSKCCNMAKRNHDHPLLEHDSTTKDSELILENDQPKSKKSRSEYKFPSSSNINFHQASTSSACSMDELDSEAIAQMKERIYRAAALRPMSSVTEGVIVKKPKRKNVRISKDPQTAAARRRRERISERIRALQKLVPGGSNMDTASMLDEAANYLKFLRTQVNALEAFGFNIDPIIINNNFTSLSSIPFSYPFPMQPHFPLQNLNSIHRPKC